ncbi:MAG: sulfur carrier protein ThiS [Actinomycetia bacterium]|nr:sulfur carrier protein ThiS [Actinomycetes bacterium]
MTVHVNGTPRQFATPPTVDDLLGALDLPRSDVAVAIDGSVVPRTQWATTVVGSEADVEVVTAMQGG